VENFLTVEATTVLALGGTYSMSLIRIHKQLIHPFNFGPLKFPELLIPAYSQAKLKTSEDEELFELGTGHVYQTNDTDFTCSNSVYTSKSFSNFRFIQNVYNLTSN
jgi:hypothetical protein